jgi:hypothetical protein
MLRRVPPPAKPRREREPDEFASFVVDKPRAVMATGLGEKRPTLKLPAPKIEQRKRQPIRDAANGEECTVRIVGACNHCTDTTVAAHWPGLVGDRGMGMKAFDLCIAFACSGCHDAIDGRRPPPPGASRTSMELDYHRGHLRTLVRLAQKGLL